MEFSPASSLGELRVTPTRTQLFMFSAITWNRHRIHFDGHQAQTEGLSDVAVQRGLLGNFLARFVTGWVGRAGSLERLRWKVTRSAFPGRELRCVGEVTAVADGEDGRRHADCSLRILDPEGEQVAEGEARVRLEP